MTLRHIGLAVAATVALSVSTSCGADEPRQLAGVQRHPLPRVDQATLPDVAHDDEPFEFIADEGELLIVYFGYTGCPDVCPTTLFDIKSALGKLDDAKAERVELAFATVDPARDDPDLITGYVQSFVPDASALRTTDDAAFAAVADAFGVVYDVTTTDAGEVEVVHSGYTYVVDDTGHLIVTWPFGVPSDDIAADLDLIFDDHVST